MGGAVRTDGSMTKRQNRTGRTGCAPARFERAGWFFLVLALLAGFSSAALAQDRATVRISPEPEGFGRIHIEFANRTLLPGYTARLANGVLVIEFDNPVDLSLEPMSTDLDRYINVARKDPDGLGLRFALTQQTTTINTLEGGENLFIDLLPDNWTGLAPGLPDSIIRKLANRADEALKKLRDADRAKVIQEIEPVLDFRVGRAPTFTRFVFSWNLPYDVQFIRQDDVVSVVFNHDGDMGEALERVNANLPPLVKGVDAFHDQDRLKVLFGVDPVADVRAFRDENAYIVDVASTDILAGVDDLSPLPATGPGASGASGIVNSRGAVNSPLPMAKQEAAALPGKRGAVRESEGSLPQLVFDTPQNSVQDEPDADIDLPLDNPEAFQVPDNSDEDLTRLRVQRTGETTQVIFPFDQEVAASVFRRNNVIWAVFDSTRPMNIDALKDILGPVVRSVSQLPFDDKRVVRMQLSRTTLASLSSDGQSWILSIGDSILEPNVPLTFRRENGPNGDSELRIDLENAERVHLIEDPVVGDSVVAVTARTPIRGFVRDHALVDVRLHASMHGVGLSVIADGISVALERDVVVVRSDAGLKLSRPVSTTQLKEVEEETETLLTRPGRIDFARWLSNRQKYFDRIRDFELRSAMADEDLQGYERIKFAKFLIAFKLGNEALGVLKTVRDDNEEAATSQAFDILFAAATVLANRPEEAVRLLAEPHLANDADAAVWRALAAADARDWLKVRQAVPRGESVIGEYSRDLYGRFFLGSARASLEANDIGAARVALAKVDPLNATRANAANYELVKALIAAREGRLDDAERSFQAVIGMPYMPAKMEAEYERTATLLLTDNIEKEEAIENLERISATWRGDIIELKALNLLADLYAADSEYRAAFETMKAANYAYPQEEITRELQNGMIEAFARLFLEGEADQMNPIEALALFYDFRQLTPVGRRGDEMVRRLAQRLIDVDLVDQAVELLTHQVEERLTGAARAQVAADLAVIVLSEGKPRNALDILRKSRQAQLPDSLRRQRRIVEARAHAELEKPDVAIGLLSGLDGRDVRRVVTDALWKARRWQEVAEGLETMHGQRWSDSAPLKKLEQQDILRSAIAYTLAEDGLGLQRLRNKFAKKMGESASASAFDAVTQPIDKSGFDFRKVASQIASVDSLEAFLQDYRDIYGPSTAEAARRMNERERMRQEQEKMMQEQMNSETSDPAAEDVAGAAEDQQAAQG